MVDIDIPKNYTASPSSFSGTPHLTINRDVTVDFDSSNAFEGMTGEDSNSEAAQLTYFRARKASRSMV